MVALKKYNLKGKEVGTVDLDDALFQVEANRQMIKDYIVALRANARQWSANTKGRSEVNHSTKKPHRQKGTGSARQGTLAAPQCRGGGIVFGPRPKFDQHVRINKKERQLAIRALLSEKIKASKVIVMEDAAFDQAAWKAPKTKVLAQFLDGLNLYGRNVLFLTEGAYHKGEEGERSSVGSEKYDFFKLSLRNIPRSNFRLAANLNGYDLAAAYHVIVSESAIEELKQMWM